MINRGAVIIRPSQPYLDWATNLDDSNISPQAIDEKTVYLISNYEDDIEAWEILSSVYERIFKNELLGWNTDETTWPKQRSLTMFKDWFNIELHSIVEDLCDDDILEEDD